MLFSRRPGSHTAGGLQLAGVRLARQLAVAMTLAIAAVPAAEKAAGAATGGGVDFPHDVAGALTLELTATPDTARTNERIIMELLACNSADTDATGVVISGIIPTGLSFTVATDGATCNTGSCSSGATLTWNLGTIGAHRCRTVHIAPNVTGLDAAVIDFSFDLTADGGGAVSDDLSITVETTPALALELADSADPVGAGDLLTYTLTYGNRGASANVLAAELSATVPAGTTVVSIEDGGVESAGEITWLLGTLGAGKTGRARFTVMVDAGAIDGTALVGEAEITGTSVVGARATQGTAIVGAETLNVHVATAPDPVALNSRIIHDVHVCNSGLIDATGLVLDSLLPNGVSFTVSSDTATCTTGACGTAGIVTWNLGTLAAGRCRNVQASMIATLAADGELIRALFRARADTGSLSSATRAVSRDTTPALQLALAEDRDPVAPGETLTYTLTFGSPVATANSLDTTLRAWVPPGTTVLSIGEGGVETDGVITWDLGVVRAGQSGQRQFTVTVDAGVPNGTAIDAVAQIDADEQATFGAQATQSTMVNDEGLLSLRMTAMPDPVRLNERIVYDFTICNTDTVDITGLTADLLQPNGVSFLAATDGATCTTGACATGGVAAWTLGTLAAGRCRTLQASNNNATGTAGSILTVGFRVEADGQQMAVALRPVVVDTAPNLSLNLFEGRDPSAAGSMLTYTLMAANPTTENIADTVLRIPVPDGTTVAWISDDGTEANGAVSWPLGTFPPGVSVERQVMVTADQALADGSSILAEADLVGGSTEPFLARASQATSLVSAEALTFNLIFNPNPTRNLDTPYFELTACNHSVLDATGVVYDMFVPNHLTFTRGTDGPTCTNGSCSTGGLVTWTIGDIPAGRCRTVAGTSVPQGALDGDLVPLSARLRADGGSVAVAGRSLAIRSTQPITTAITEQVDPVAPGATTTYAISFGNRGATTVSDGELRVSVPAEATVVSASNGAVLNGNEIVWSICPLAAGQSGTLSYTATLADGATLVDGAALLSEAQLSGDAGNDPTSHAAATTGILANAPLSLEVTASPAIAKQSDLVTYEFEACNDTVDQATGITIGTFTPRGTIVITINDGGVAQGSGEIKWTLATLDAGTCTTVSMVARMNAGVSYPGDGTVIFTSGRLFVDGAETAIANTVIRACNVDPGACAIKPPPPCAAPQTRSCNRSATDALVVLRAAVGLLVCPLCECDVDGSGVVSAVDSLAALRVVVGLSATLRCPACF